MIVALSVVPMAAFIYGVVSAPPHPKASAGELISPPVERPRLNETVLYGKVTGLSDLKGRWLLLSVAGGHCDEACGHRLYIQKQLWTLMDKDKPRMQTVWLVNDEEPINPLLMDKLSDEVVLKVSKTDLAAWLLPAQGKTLEQSFYLLDPEGRWMMRFPADQSLAIEESIKKDLEKLLKASALWTGPQR
jgi:cytochrome oxidase Cu insertion factor (SCO1/SenC/PrrC family)